MATTRIGTHINAPRGSVYQLLIDPEAVRAWMVPDGMVSEVHRFEPEEGGVFSITVTQDEFTAAGTTEQQHHAYYGRFLSLVPEERVMEVLEFVTEIPDMAGAQTITFTLADADGGTDLEVLHEGVPPGMTLADNEVAWEVALAKMVALVERGAIG
ncbi:SRPBCC domain-containing protein [Nocardia sp. NPDC050718]|uniref:SRPBCC domain-containing protein n=1 Tax=Nocardia sp. NPDC050718 TaxID=3155788 RepID=UPI0033C0A044